jgi:hypothetical protein
MASGSELRTGVRSEHYSSAGGVDSLPVDLHQKHAGQHDREREWSFDAWERT